MEDTVQNKREFIISYKGLITLYVYYTLGIFAGLALIVFVMLHEITIANSYPILINSILGCIGGSILGSSIFYSRKLYKLSLDNRLLNKNENQFHRLGIFMYFFLRPIFAVAFSILVVLAFKVSILVVCVKDGTLDFGFIYLTMFISFFTGFSSGDILAVLEQVGKNKMEKFFNYHD